jgi:hypothetical protein
LPAAFWIDARPSRTRFTLVALFTAVSAVAQLPGVLVKDQQIHQMRFNMLTPEERAASDSDYVVAWRLLAHKLVAPSARETYSVSTLGPPGDRVLDLSEVQTFRGINIWTEHTARRFGKPVIRYLPLLGLAVIGVCVVQLIRIWRVRRDRRAG